MLYQAPKLDTLFSEELAARLCREYTTECIETLAEHMRNKRAPGISLAATNSLLDRAYGKPKEIKSLSGPGGSMPKIKVEIEFIDNQVRDQDSATTIDQAPQPVFED